MCMTFISSPVHRLVLQAQLQPDWARGRGADAGQPLPRHLQLRDLAVQIRLDPAAEHHAQQPGGQVSGGWVSTRVVLHTALQTRGHEAAVLLRVPGLCALRGGLPGPARRHALGREGARVRGGHGALPVVPPVLQVRLKICVEYIQYLHLHIPYSGVLQVTTSPVWSRMRPCRSATLRTSTPRVWRARPGWSPTPPRGAARTCPRVKSARSPATAGYRTTRRR